MDKKEPSDEQLLCAFNPIIDLILNYDLRKRHLEMIRDYILNIRGFYDRQMEIELERIELEKGIDND